MTDHSRIALFPVTHGAGNTYSSPERWLDAYSVPSLQTLCRSRGIPFRESVSKRALVSLLAAELFRSSHLRTRFEELGEPELAWLRRFHANDGMLTLSQIDTYADSELAQTALRRLTTRGLVLPGPFDGHIPRGTFDVTEPAGPLWCPAPVQLLSNGGSVESLLRTHDGPVTRVRKGDRRIVEHDLMAMADLLGQAPVRRLKSGFPGKRFLSRVATLLHAPVDDSNARRIEESGYPLMLYELLGTLGMLKNRQDTVSTSSRAEEFFQLPPVERAQAVYDSWRDMAWYNELYQIPALQFERSAPDYVNGDGKTDDLPTPERLGEARDFISELIALAAPGEWIALESVMYAAYVRNDAFLMKPPQSYYYSRQPLYHGVWTTEDANAHGLWSNGLERAGNWHVVEGGFIREVVCGSLHRLGLLDLAEDGEGGTLIRMNSVGAWLLGGGPEPDLSIPAGRALVVQPNFDVIVFPEGQDVSLLWPLMQSAEVISRDVTLTLRITSDSIYRAAQKKISAQHVLRLLEENARAPVPENVRQAMCDWDARFQQVTITTSADLVEASSKAEMDRFLKESNHGQNLVRRLSDTIGIVAGAASKLPPMTALDYGKPLPPSITVSDDLEIAIDTGRESWKLRPQLERFAEQTGANRYRITAASVAAARDRGITAADALGVIEQAALEKIPARAAFKLHGLFGTLGPAAVQNVTIMEVTHEAVLTSMMDIDEFQNLLIQRLGPTTALVRSDRVDALSGLLEEFGIAVDDTLFGKRSLLPNPTGGTRETVGEDTTGGRRLQTHSARKVRELLDDAIRQNRRVRIRYRSTAGRRRQERTVDPISIERRHGIAYLTAFCHLRGEVQTFRIPSIDGIELLGAQSRD